MSPTRPGASTVLFVHGAHLEGWCWLLVMDRLARDGIDCRSIDLPFTGYGDDVRCVRSAIASARTHAAVHVVCHSYGGLPVAEAGHDASHLTFVAGRLPLAGESPAAMTGRWGFPEFQACMQRGADEVVRLSPAAGPLMFNRTSPSVAALAMERMRPMRSAVSDTPIADPAWVSVASSYVVCSDDRAVRPDAQRARAALVGASVELDADHSPFFSRTEELAAFIAEQHRGMAGG
jgi:pimeloyl-ACP methyl ester carboxylesterase